MNKSWRVILAFVGIFIAGTVTGGLIALRFAQKWDERRSQQQAHPQRAPAANQQFGPQLLRRLTEQLDLTKEQQEQIKPIETRTTEELRRVRRETQHTTELIIERMQDDIAAVLTPEQRVKFDDMIAKARERIKKFMQEQEQQLRNRRETPVLDRLREGRPAKEK